MLDQKNQNFNHLKIHTEYSICEGAIKIDDVANFCKDKKIKSIGISDSLNLCGALEFSENISKAGTQPIIGTQINFKYKGTMGKLPLIALNENGYKKIIDLSSKSYLENSLPTEPHCSIEDLYTNIDGVLVLSGSINGLFGKLFDKGLLPEIEDLYKKLSSIFGSNFYLEIQRHGDQNEKLFENFNLQKSNEIKIPIIATHEVYYLDKSMHEAHDALICIGNKTYINEKKKD